MVDGIMTTWGGIAGRTLGRIGALFRALTGWRSHRRLLPFAHAQSPPPWLGAAPGPEVNELFGVRRPSRENLCRSSARGAR